MAKSIEVVQRRLCARQRPRKVERVTVLCLLTMLILNFGANRQTIGFSLLCPSSDYVPLKWGLIALGNFDYYHHPPGENAIQKTEHWLQSEGIPYDVIDDDNIEAPTDAPSLGKVPLQYSNGTLRYGVFIIIMNNYRDSTVANSNYIYWAVGNGTNAIVMGEAAKYVSGLFNITPSDVSVFTDYSITWINFNVLREFDDGIEKYSIGQYNVTFDSPEIRSGYDIHANISDSSGKTVWYTCLSNTGRNWIGMMNTTYGSGKVYWQSNIPSTGYFLVYQVFYVCWNAFKIVAHSIRFMFEQVKNVDFGLQGYKEWRGAITYRLDQDSPVPLSKPDEEALKVGWYVDMVTPSLGYLVKGGNLSDGIPSGYVGSPPSGAKWGTFTDMLVSIPTPPYYTFTSRNFTIYPKVD